MYKYPAEIFIVFFNAAVKPFDLRLLQKTQYTLLKLPAPFARDDLHQLYFLSHRLLDNAVELGINCTAIAKDVMQVQFEFTHRDIISLKPEIPSHFQRKKAYSVLLFS